MENTNDLFKILSDMASKITIDPSLDKYSSLALFPDKNQMLIDSARKEALHKRKQLAVK